MAFDRDSKIVPMLYFRSSLFSSILAIVKATKQVRKCASICSFVQTYTGLADIDLIYGRAERMAMMNNFQFKVVLGVSDTDTQEYFAKLIGNKIIQRMTHTFLKLFRDSPVQASSLPKLFSFN